MTPEGAPETARRRTTSEGQYQSGHDEPGAPRGPGTRSPDFSNALALNAGGPAREVRRSAGNALQGFRIAVKGLTVI